MIRCAVLTLIVLLPAVGVAQTGPKDAREAAVPHSDGVPFTLSRATQYDITSRINGQRYRIYVSTPVNSRPDISYPAVYLLDGNQYFATATEIVTRLSYLMSAESIAPAIIVGIGYPTDDPGEVIRRRAFDLTPSALRPPVLGIPTSGGGDAFLRVIEEEIKPFVLTRYSVDRTRQTIYGQSLGGLMVLRVLFRNPAAFSTYIVSSPSIWFNDREVLADEDAFSKRARAGELSLKILITSAAQEQYRGDDPKLLAADRRMVDNGSELATRLAQLNPSMITVVRTIFDGENHGSVPPSSLTRGLRFALSVN
jgi:predicted alpha/beta superfamily hydrolase